MISQEIQEKFLKENWISINEAISHIQTWISEKNFQSAENWINELKKFLWTSNEVQLLEKDLFEMKNSQQDLWKSEPIWNTKPTIEDENIQHEEKSERFIAALSYASYLVIVPLILKKDSKLWQHHSKQWLVIVIIFFLFSILWWIFWFVWWILSLLQIAIAIYWWMKAYKWEMWIAPVIWDAAKKIKL